MKKLLFLLPFTSLAFGAQAPIYMAPPATTYQAPQKNQKTSKPTNAAEAEMAALAKTQQGNSKGTNEIMVISPELRGKDIQAAIKYLATHIPTSKPSVKLADGSEITGIMDVDVMPGGTILIFKISSLKGIQYKVVNIEEVQSISG